MGQAWCKERTSKAQDSKSPLDRVFVRCAHRIYPGLKEEGSVLGGATQRVTSSEIGYAGSPPREFLARGRSIDSVDRPFHPSDWVDVNLEVPTTPDANIPRRPSVQVAGANPRHAAPAESPVCGRKKDAAPVPPPRKGRRNRGRPLPPKPDELLEKTGSDSKHVDASDEPFYSSVNSAKATLDDYATMDDVAIETRKKTVEAVRRSKDVFEHKVNGTGKVITSDVVSGKRSSHGERKSAKAANSHQQHANQIAKIEEEAAKSSHEDSSCKCDRQDRDKLEVNARPKNYSTVSLPNYDELDVARHAIEELQEKEDERRAEERGRATPKRPARISTGSLPVESFLLPFSQKTSVRLEDYIPRRDSTEDLSEHQLPAKLASNGNAVAQGEFFKYDSNKLADWQVPADRDGNCESNDRNVPQESSKGNSGSAGVDVCDSSGYATIEETKATILPRASRDLEKPESFGKAFDCGGSQSDCDEAYEDSKSMRGEKMAKCLESPTAVEIRKPAAPPSCNDPFFLCAREEKRVAAKMELSEREEWRETKEQQQQHPLALSSSQLHRSSATFTRSLSNESEPCELFAYESKELPSRGGNEEKEMTKAISEESLPREMLDEVVMDVAPSQDFRHSLEDEEQQEKAIAKTPPPSPESKEPKMKVEFLENEHSTLLKILKEEATEGSNVSSMTPSLTELEVALSDMLEKEEEDEEKGDSSSRRSTSSRVVSFESSTPYSKGRKVSLCPWEEKRMILGDVDFHDECSRILPEEETRRKESSLLLPRESLAKEANALQEVCQRSPSPPCGISAPPRRKHRSKEGSDLFSSSSDRLI